jgi:predicted RNA-binding Zn ribbon-like protein
MFRLDEELLKELGLSDLPPQEKTKMFNHIYETLEMRVGTKLANQMTDEQLTEFESFIDKNDEAGALKWLETNFPDYKQVVASELESLKAEIKAVAPQILASALESAAQDQSQAPIQESIPQQPIEQPVNDPNQPTN